MALPFKNATWFIDSFIDNSFINDMYSKKICCCHFEDHALTERTVRVNKNCNQHAHFLQLDNKIEDFINGEMTMTVFNQLGYEKYFQNTLEYKLFKEAEVKSAPILSTAITVDNNSIIKYSNNIPQVVEIQYSPPPVHTAANLEKASVIIHSIHDFRIGDWWLTEDKLQLKIVGLDLEKDIVKVTQEGVELQYAITYGISSSFVQSWSFYTRSSRAPKNEKIEPELSPFLLVMEQFSRTEEN